jgi:hypothetical protein
MEKLSWSLPLLDSKVHAASKQDDDLVQFPLVKEKGTGRGLQPAHR